MAKILPPYVDRRCKSQGEKMIFDIFKNNSFTKDWIILHSLNLAEHTKRLYGEIDFLLLIPNGGIFIMEVKGGDVKHTNGTWHFTNKSGFISRGKNPFDQGQDAMFSLKAGIKKQFGEKYNNIQFGFLVSFPQINFDRQSVEYRPWQIFDKEAISKESEFFFKNLIHEYSEKHKTQSWFSLNESLPNKESLEEICDFLRGDFERVRTIKERLDEFDNQVKIYTEEQFRILDSIQLNDRSVIQGSAGTGKTVIAIESAIRAAAEGKTVFLTCYNRLIGEWMKKQVEEWGDKITVGNLHSYLFELSKGFDYDKSQTSKQDFYTQYLPTLLKNIFQKGIARKFDKIIIDEGQDLIRKEYLDLFNSMVTGGLSNGNWEIYGDFEKQAIYSQLSKNEMIELLKGTGLHSNFLLRINCRNTKQVGEETSLLSGFEKPPFLLTHLEGVAVEYFFYTDNNHQKTIMSEQLKKLSENKLPSNELTIISPRKFGNSCSYGFSDFIIKEIKNVAEITASQNFYCFSSIHSYKGMECNYILITDIEDITSEFSKCLMYIGMSRAKYGLILLISESMKIEYRNILKNKLK